MDRALDSVGVWAQSLEKTEAEHRDGVESLDASEWVPGSGTKPHFHGLTTPMRTVGFGGYLQAQSLPGKPGRLLWHQEDPAPNHHQGVNSCTVLSEAESEKISHNLARENFS